MLETAQILTSSQHGTRLLHPKPPTQLRSERMCRSVESEQPDMSHRAIGSSSAAIHINGEPDSAPRGGTMGIVESDAETEDHPGAEEDAVGSEGRSGSRRQALEEVTDSEDELYSTKKMDPSDSLDLVDGDDVAEGKMTRSSRKGLERDPPDFRRRRQPRRESNPASTGSGAPL